MTANIQFVTLKMAQNMEHIQDSHSQDLPPKIEAHMAVMQQKNIIIFFRRLTCNVSTN